MFPSIQRETYTINCRGLGDSCCRKQCIARRPRWTLGYMSSTWTIHGSRMYAGGRFNIPWCNQIRNTAELQRILECMASRIKSHRAAGMENACYAYRDSMESCTSEEYVLISGGAINWWGPCANRCFGNNKNDISDGGIFICLKSIPVGDGTGCLYVHALPLPLVSPMLVVECFRPQECLHRQPLPGNSRCDS